MSSWQTKSSKVVYENPWLIVHEDEVVMPNGKDGIYGVVESKSEGVFVIPVDDEGNTYVVQQERYTTKQTAWQFVGGRTDGEPVEQAAKRELLEEMGLKAEKIVPLGSFYNSSGMTTFRATYCLATELRQDNSHLDDNEAIIQIVKLPFRDIEAKITSGDINSTESIALYYLAKAYLEQEKIL